MCCQIGYAIAAQKRILARFFLPCFLSQTWTNTQVYIVTITQSNKQWFNLYILSAIWSFARLKKIVKRNTVSRRKTTSWRMLKPAKKHTKILTKSDIRTLSGRALSIANPSDGSKRKTYYSFSGEGQRDSWLQAQLYLGAWANWHEVLSRSFALPTSVLFSAPLLMLERRGKLLAAPGVCSFSDSLRLCLQTSFW